MSDLIRDVIDPAIARAIGPHPYGSFGELTVDGVFPRALLADDGDLPPGVRGIVRATGAGDEAIGAGYGHFTPSVGDRWLFLAERLGAPLLFDRLEAAP